MQDEPVAASPMPSDAGSGAIADVEAFTGKGNIFVRAWRGQVHLAMVWWGFGIPFKAITWAANSRWAYDNLYAKSAAVAAAIWLATMVAYVVLSVMVWRCAPNTQEKGWKWVARGLLVAGWVWSLYNLAFVGSKSAA